jgi:uncharacterized protein (UPF0147 family)
MIYTFIYGLRENQTTVRKVARVFISNVDETAVPINVKAQASNLIQRIHTSFETT